MKIFRDKAKNACDKDGIEALIKGHEELRRQLSDAQQAAKVNDSLIDVLVHGQADLAARTAAQRLQLTAVMNAATEAGLKVELLADEWRTNAAPHGREFVLTDEVPETVIPAQVVPGKPAQWVLQKKSA